MQAADPRPVHGSLAASLGSALRAGSLAGLCLGLIDGLVAAGRMETPGAYFAGAVAAAVLVYGALWCGLLLGAAALLHPWLRRRGERQRLGLLLGLSFGAWLTLEIYWWSHPWVFYGYSSLSTERLLSALVQALLGFALGGWMAGLLARSPRGVLTALQRCAWGAWLAGALFLALDGRRGADDGALNARNRDLPNLLFVIVDALRADQLGCYGNAEVETPNLDRLAQRGVLFERCSSQAPITLASFGSILTGKYPRRHGLLSQLAGARLAQSNTTLFHHLETAQRADGARMAPGDWSVGAFLTGVLSQGSGLMRGIDTYSEAMMGRDVVDLDRRWSVFRAELLLWIVKDKLQQRIDSSLVVNQACSWMRGRPERRFAALVHLYSTHTPYDPPARWRSRYLDPSYAGPIEVFHARHREAIERGELDLSEADLQQIRGLYAGGVSQADAMIGILLGELDALGLAGNTLVVVTADHGESLGEQGHWEHDHMFQTNLMVPLIMALPGRLPAARRVGALASSIDILPTLCDLYDLELPDPAGERGGVDGVSLLPVIEGQETAVRPFTFAENEAFIAVQDGTSKLVLPRALPGSPRPDAGALFAPFATGTRAAFYDLSADPAERENRAAEGGPAVQRLYEALTAWDAAMPEAVFELERSSRHLEQVELLRELGYTQGTGGER